MPVCLFASDLDGTLLGKADAALRFTATWERLSKKQRPLLCYNTERVVDDARAALNAWGLPTPDFMLTGSGTTVLDERKGKRLKDFSDVVWEGADLKAAERIVAEQTEAARKPERYQGRFKLTWWWHDASPEDVHALEEALKEAKLDLRVVYRDQRDLDILPQIANKGYALRWLLRHVDIRNRDVVVAGDSGIDTVMFTLRGVRGIVVENAQPELLEGILGRDVYQAREPFADGVLEGLKHFGVIEGIEAAQAVSAEELPAPKELHGLVGEESVTKLPSESRAYLQLAYNKAVEGLRKCITPLGYVACAPDVNVARGTDENYRRVWARDGAITVIGAAGLKDKDIRKCNRDTLECLLEQTLPSGQVPANVSIDDERPDYSGVGGISSIDSGLWLIIACYEFVRASRGLSFLRKHRATLARCMRWLDAHDSNNDGLLEIPESGDWMDLFNRSYNVLYDEVLWYRAQLCYGRLLEQLGDHDAAGERIRAAEATKVSLLQKFWPSTAFHRDLGTASFAESQYSLGDTHYLLAQVTPFGFDWRCDVYGNILAHLFNVLDTERAKIAFHFMWGVGVNMPYPVANLYPPVNAGDPDWRPYYLVNLLNLPNHYHNGGIWPYIGGQWVRYIARLGLHNIALQELIKLAELNQRGLQGEWEFNEWAHGQTGHPMGKAFQAWSCASFIHACHELGVAGPGANTA
jgi:sucrose-6F-phosphate phosphohydrolase